MIEHNQVHADLPRDAPGQPYFGEFELFDCPEHGEPVPRGVMRKIWGSLGLLAGGAWEPVDRVAEAFNVRPRALRWALMSDQRCTLRLVGKVVWVLKPGR